MIFGAVRELWIVFAYVVMSNLAYMLVVLTLSLWLSSDLGYSDVKAGWWVTIWTAGHDALRRAGRLADRRAWAAQDVPARVRAVHYASRCS